MKQVLVLLCKKAKLMNELYESLEWNIVIHFKV